MKIAFVVGNFPVISQTFILNQIAGLLDLGHEVDILSFHTGDTKQSHPLVDRYRLLTRTTYLWDERWTWKHRFLKGDIVFWRTFFKDPARAFKCLNVFRYGRSAISLKWLYILDQLRDKGPYDIVHCQFGTFGLDFLPVQEMTKIGRKMIVQFRGYDISQFLIERGEGVYQDLFKKADHFLTNCEYFKKRLLKLGSPADHTDVIYSGIDCDKFRFKERAFPADGKVRIGLTGRLVEKKGVEFAIRAIADLAQKGLDVSLHLIGDGPLERSLRDLCGDLSVSGRVYFLGAKDQSQIVEILDGCHLFIAPSITAKTGDEDAPVNVLKEAMAMGLPVVATRHGGIPELVEEDISGYLVPEKDAVALAEKLAYLIEHPERWKAMGVAGRSRVEQAFDTRNLSLRLETIYRNVLASKDRRS